MHTVMSSILLLFLIFTTNTSGLSTQDRNLYGPYNINYTKYELCAGPKSNNITKGEVSLISKGYKYLGKTNFTYSITAHLDEVKILVYSLPVAKPKTLLWTYKLNDPCKHFAMAKIIETKFKAPDCILTKGEHSGLMELDEMIGSLLGPSFFYGEYLFKILATSNKGNIACILLDWIADCLLVHFIGSLGIIREPKSEDFGLRSIIGFGRKLLHAVIVIIIVKNCMLYEQER